MTESEFVMFAKILDKVKKKYHSELEKRNIDAAYYPIVVTIWLADENFKPFKKVIEIDERERGEGG